ncbi:major facilitator superfamily domain-containing protein [Xylariaceae sp. FL1019]|nr:major facilitator superfamily domain-containing protein [Xylariaceae sp. FL1019]
MAEDNAISINEKASHSTPASEARPSQTNSEDTSEAPTTSTVPTSVEVLPEESTTDSAPPYSIYNHRQKLSIIIGAALGAFFASWSSHIYLPALSNVAEDLHTTIGKANLSVTTYMIFQGISPIFIGGFADALGRRPIYLICFTLYIVVNINLASSDSYATLLALRSLQSITISSAQALSQGVIADITTPAERGQYAAWTTLPAVLGPSLGPVVGGSVTQYWSWRHIFYVLAIAGGLELLLIILYLPETCRKVVNDGSTLPPKWNRTALQLWRQRQNGQQQPHNDVESATAQREEPQPKAKGAKVAWERLSVALSLFKEKELLPLFIYGGLHFAGLFAVGTAAPTLLHKKYGYNSEKIGLLYLPLAGGSVLSGLLTGKLLGWNYKRHCRKHGIDARRDTNVDLSDFPIERARIEVILPTFVLSLTSIAGWGWAIEQQVHISVVVILIFLLGLGFSGVSQVFNALIADLRPNQAASASAANNIIKFGLGAAFSAFIEPLIEAVNAGKAFSIVAIFYVVVSPCLIIVLRKGMKWRKEATEKERRREQERSQPVEVESQRSRLS